MSELLQPTPTAPTTPTTPTAPDPRLEAWSRWLAVWFVVVGLISVAMIVVRQVPGALFNLALFGDTDTPAGFSAEAVEYQRFIWGVAGAITIGWMLLAAPVARGPLRRGERWAWVALCESFAGWFVIDCALSIALGFAENVIVNVLFVIGVVPALVATRPGRVRPGLRSGRALQQ